jgi:hypothetical protein
MLAVLPFRPELSVLLVTTVGSVPSTAEVSMYTVAPEAM